MPKAKINWLNSGLSLLVTHGVSGLTIDGMCQALGVTKGSFYHHFKNLQDFKGQLLTHWKQIDTQEVADTASKMGAGLMSVDNLINLLASRTAEAANPELAIRAWSLQDDDVRDFVAQIDQMRIQLIQSVFEQNIDDPKRANLLARMLYAMLVGSYSIIPPIEQENVRLSYQEFIKLLDS